jgi:hypothetical protein
MMAPINGKLQAIDWAAVAVFVMYCLGACALIHALFLKPLALDPVLTAPAEHPAIMDVACRRG